MKMPLLDVISYIDSMYDIGFPTDTEDEGELVPSKSTGISQTTEENDKGKSQELIQSIVGDVIVVTRGTEQYPGKIIDGEDSCVFTIVKLR